jgi:hypothetical protein
MPVTPERVWQAIEEFRAAQDSIASSPNESR